MKIKRWQQKVLSMPDEHPAKQAWDKEKDKEDGGEEEKPSGQKLRGSDFDRDGGDDKPKEKDDSDSKEAPEEEPTFRTLNSQFKSDELEKVSFHRNASEEAQEMEMEIADELLAHYSKGGEDEEMFDVVTGESERLVSISKKP